MEALRAGEELEDPPAVIEPAPDPAPVRGNGPTT
jgi:hypothetical protein